MVQTMRYFAADAFSGRTFGGNPAGVVIIPEGNPFPDRATMIKIAAEVRYSETAFVQQNSQTEFTIRYFTPAAEVDLCGHATIAAFSVLRDKGIVPTGTKCINHTLAADLEVTVGEKIMMQMAPPAFYGEIKEIGRLEQIMKCKSGKMPVEIISTGLPDIIYPVSTIEDLNSMTPNMDALSAFSAEMNVVGVHAFALSQDGYTAHVRNFAPLYDIPEESATGTANAALTYYLYRHGIIAPGTGCTFMQGEAMERPSAIATELKENGTVYVGGNSCIFIEGELIL